MFDQIRDIFTRVPDAKSRGYAPGRFSFNVSGGRCEACDGNGSNRLEMDFLADVWVTCPVCQGKRFGRETLQVRFKGKSIADVLNMDVQEALEHFANIPKIAGMLQTLRDVGLDYIKLGQPSPTLSGGEAQRIKLARELVKKGTGKTLYILDEPTTGLHFDDVRRLLDVLHGFTDQGNTVVVIEHNLDVVKTADWIIDLGPEGGADGGQVVAQGPPQAVAAVAQSYTGQALLKVLGGRLHSIEKGAVKPPKADLHPANARLKSIWPRSRYGARGSTISKESTSTYRAIGSRFAAVPAARARVRWRLTRSMRRAAQICREPLELCPPVFGPPAKTQGRAHQRPLASDLYRAKGDEQEPALDGWHGDGDL